ncbi:MAG: Gfo/Idh/MocA family oxidoreductase [Gemmatimonadetes bacterium]|nr:Gfo/Idh/MocA family oxidoreductase [Gemmatimonadota bacterium]HPF62547.1 Gfo/Idh/MocA family oxidoreductase [Gemmatimonadales bacterium]
MIVRIGVIGAGVIGRLRIATVQAHPGTTLAAVFDPAAGAAEAAAGGAPTATTLDAFFAHEMDAVIISSPVQHHDEAALRAFALGLHVFVEKPMANTTAGCRAMTAAAVAAGRHLAVGFNLRYFPSFRFMRQVVDDGTIGEVDHVRLFGGHDGLANFRAEWQYRAPESGGGATMDIGIHLADLGRYYLGDITEVYGQATERVWQVPGSEDNAIAVLRNPAGVAASYHATWNEWAGYRVFAEVYGTLGMVRGSYGPMRNLLITHERPGAARRVQRRLYPEVMLREKLRSWEVTTQLAFAEELADFVARLGGGDGGVLADGHDGLRSVEVSEAIRESARTREAVHLPPLGRMTG